MPEETETPDPIATLKQQHAEELATLKAEFSQKLRSAAKIQNAFKALQERNRPAAEYLDALARGEEPPPFWQTTTPDREEDDLTAEPWERAIERMRQEQHHANAQLLQAINAQISNLASPLSQLQAKNAIDQAAAAIDKDWGRGSFERIRSQVEAFANEDSSLLNNPKGLRMIAEAELGKELRQQTKNGRQRWQQEAIDNVAPPHRAGRGDEALDLDGFADTDLLGMATAIFNDRLPEMDFE